MQWKALWEKYKPYVWQVLLALAVGGLSALISGNMDVYSTLVRPPLSPPGWLFPVAWTILYVLMGVAAGMVWKRDTPERKPALFIYYIQLAMNFLWSPLFFRLGWLTVAAVWLGLMILAIYVTYCRFRAIRPVSGYLLLPYLVWCLFAFYLNIGFVVLN